MTDPRLALAAGITGALNAGKPTKQKYVVVTDESAVATIDRRTIIVSLQGFEPLPEAPMGCLTVDFIVRVLVPEESRSAAENAAWDAATDVAFAIEKIPGCTYKTAKKALFNNRYLGYDLEVTSDAQKKEV